MMRRDGCARAPALAVAVGIVVAGLAVGALLAGCGASPIRQHAIAARSVIAVLRSSEVAITEATRMSLARCEGEIADARLDCIGRVADVAERAAGARDVLIAPATAYRDAVLLAGDEAASPELADYLGVVARPLIAGWRAFADALRALGVPVPVVSIPVTEEVQ